MSRWKNRAAQAPPAWQDLLLGKVESGCVGPGDPSPALVLPGAFNPLHDGHRRMIAGCPGDAGQPAAVELSIFNVDKPPLDYMEIERRLGQFSADRAVYLSRAATFEEKSRLFAGATFIVGVDTLRRIADPQYYGGDPAAWDGAMRADRRPRLPIPGFRPRHGRGLRPACRSRSARARFAPFAAKCRPRSSARTFLRPRFGSRGRGEPAVTPIAAAADLGGGACRRWRCRIAAPFR